ncbi:MULTISPECIES: hypothetical protein [Enterococcus]|uniref:Uncharacterized protein n=1 Tax=Candidatus Enterococcus murrayae TaxID=2815321 RepID=A0ABS3HK94_9ENTE|nr:hypothetical protein [Enterococcus sp. MJM16]MBO0453883.1 hypothetical protein [Enterococcus sp. MJM16]
MFISVSEFKFLSLIERNMHDRIYRMITVQDCETKRELTFVINRFIEIPKFRKYEKIILEIHLTMRGRKAVPIIKQIKRKEDE